MLSLDTILTGLTEEQMDLIVDPAIQAGGYNRGSYDCRSRKSTKSCRSRKSRSRKSRSHKSHGHPGLKVELCVAVQVG